MILLKAYFTPEEAGEFQVNYRFYLENDPTTNIEISINLYSFINYGKN